jgi:hypothetical protein
VHACRIETGELLMRMRKCWTAGSLALGCLVSAMAADTTPQAQLTRFAGEAGRAGQVDAGRQFFVSKHGQEWSCASCHGESPTRNSRHASTGKVLEPLAPAFNAKSLTDTARVDKWFRRNCKDVLSRECSAAEKADVLAWLISLK